MAQFAGAVAVVLAASLILAVRLVADPVQYLVTLARSHGTPSYFLGEYLLSGLLIGVALFASNHRHLTRYAPPAMKGVAGIRGAPPARRTAAVSATM